MIEVATEATAEVVAAVQRLVPQLSSRAAVPSPGEVAAVVASPATILLVARDDASGEIVGMLTLALFRIPTGVRAWIEDVVVDQAAGRRGIGTALTQEALRRAEAAGARTVDLTSRPSRQAANRLYQKAGFQRRETNVYRWVSPAPSGRTPGPSSPEPDLPITRGLTDPRGVPGDRPGPT